MLPSEGRKEEWLITVISPSGITHGTHSLLDDAGTLHIELRKDKHHDSV
jgi:hypothetical protein